MLTNYGRKRIRFLLAASAIWIVEYVSEAAKCDLCPPTRVLVSRTVIRGTFTPKDTGYRICYECMAKAHLKREREQPKLERALYLPRAAKPARSLPA